MSFHTVLDDAKFLDRCQAINAEFEAMARRWNLTPNELQLMRGAGEAIAHPKNSDQPISAAYVRTIIRMHTASGWLSGRTEIRSWGGDYDIAGGIDRHFPRAFASPSQVTEDAMYQTPVNYAKLYDIEGPEESDANTFAYLRECTDGKFRLDNADRIITHVGLDVACWFFGVLPQALAGLADEDAVVSLSAARQRLAKPAATPTKEAA